MRFRFSPSDAARASGRLLEQEPQELPQIMSAANVATA